MKKINLLLPLLALFSLTLVSPAFAVDSTPSVSPTPVKTNKQTEKEIRNQAKNDIREIKETKKDEIKTVKAEKKELRTTKLDALKQKRAEAIYKAIRTELVKKFDVLTKTKTKIEARIAEKEAQSKDMTAAKTKLADFTKYQTAYNTDLAAFDTKFKDIATEKPSVLVAGLKTISKQIQSDLNSMRQVLVDSLKLVVRAK